jgi:hypothetical protein
MKKKTLTDVSVEVLAPTWQNDDFSPALVQWQRVNPALDSVGRILHFHQLALEAGKVSIAAALLVAIELHKVKAQHPNDWKAWCEANLTGHGIPFGYMTAHRYLQALEKTVGKTTNLYLLANGSDDEKIQAVATYTKYTNYQSLYQIYQGEGIVAKSKMGGGRERAGRKRKNEAEEIGEALDEAVNAPSLLIAAIKGDEGPIKTLWKLYKERDVFNRIDDKTLGYVVDKLNELCKAATTALKLRVK